MSSRFTVDEANDFTAGLGQITSGLWKQIHFAQRVGVPDALGLTTEEWVRTRLGGYVKLDRPERREAVAELAAEGLTQREIAEVLGVRQPTVHRDLDTNESKPAPSQVPHATDLDTNESAAESFDDDLDALIADDPDWAADVARSTVRKHLLTGFKHAAELVILKPAAIADAVDTDLRLTINQQFISLRAWMDAVEAELPSRIRRVV